MNVLYKAGEGTNGQKTQRVDRNAIQGGLLHLSLSVLHCTLGYVLNYRRPPLPCSNEMNIINPRTSFNGSRDSSVGIATR
jgi:hypothetical protein